MNKLAITAAFLMAAASSYAVTEEVPKITENVYSVVINMKTTKANVASDGFVYRSVANQTIRGFFCVDIGYDFDDVNDNNGIIIGYKGQPQVEMGNIWESVVRIGKNNTEIEAYGAIGGGDAEIMMMGFGQYDVLNERVSSLNGSVIATLEAPELNFNPVYGYDLTELYPVEDEVPTTIAFGTFSVKYSLEASKRAAAFWAMEEDAYIWFLKKMGIDVMLRST